MGLVATGQYIPSSFQSAEDVARATAIPVDVIREKFGISRKPRAAEHESASYMAVQAARQCLMEARQDPTGVDVVLWTGSEHKDHYVWSAGIKVQHELGCVNAWATDVASRCATNIVSLKLAKDIIRSDRRVNTVLLAGGHRTTDLIDFANQNTRFMFNFSDAGSAMLVKRMAGAADNVAAGGDAGEAGEEAGAEEGGGMAGGGWAELLETAVITDGAFSEDVIIPPGRKYFDVPDPDGLKQRLDPVSMRNFAKVIRDAVEGSGYGLQDIGYLALLHMKRSAHDTVLREIGLAPEKSIYLSDYGHVGAPDQVISLRLAQERGLIRRGDLVVLASAGIGYTWAASALRWGEVR